MSKDKKNGAARNKIKDTTSDRIFYTVNMIIWIIILVIVIYPLYVVMISSVSVRGKSRRSAVCPGGFFLGGV